MSQLTQKDYILIGVLAVMFFPQIISTWESRQYSSTQNLEQRVGQLENRLVSMEAKFGGIESNLNSIIVKLDQFKEPIFQSQQLSKDFEKNTQDGAAENLRQWSRINENEEAIDKMEERFSDYLKSTDR